MKKDPPFILVETIPKGEYVTLTVGLELLSHGANVIAHVYRMQVSKREPIHDQVFMYNSETDILFSGGGKSREHVR